MPFRLIKMVSLESALSSVNLDKYVKPLTDRNFSLQSLFKLSRSQVDSLVDEISMKKGHVVRFNNLIETLRPLYHSIISEEEKEPIVIEDGPSPSKVPESIPLVAPVAKVPESRPPVVPTAKVPEAKEIVSAAKTSEPKASVAPTAKAPEVKKVAPTAKASESKASAPPMANNTEPRGTPTNGTHEVMIPVKRANEQEELTPPSGSLSSNVKTLKSQLDELISNRNKTFEALQSVAVLDIEAYQSALEDVKRLKGLILNYFNK